MGINNTSYPGKVYLAILTITHLYFSIYTHLYLHTARNIMVLATSKYFLWYAHTSAFAIEKRQILISCVESRQCTAHPQLRLRSFLPIPTKTSKDDNRSAA